MNHVFELACNKVAIHIWKFLLISESDNWSIYGMKLKHLERSCYHMLFTPKKKVSEQVQSTNSRSRQFVFLS